MLLYTSTGRRHTLRLILFFPLPTPNALLNDSFSTVGPKSIKSVSESNKKNNKQQDNRRSSSSFILRVCDYYKSALVIVSFNKVIRVCLFFVNQPPRF